MALGNLASIEGLQGISRFEELRKILLSEAYAEHLDRPLAYWALPADRRLPLALLGRSLRDLLGMSYAELSATPGIGRKKIASFVGLLDRAANTDPSRLAVEPFGASNPVTAVGAQEPTDVFDPSNVSEVTWAGWRASVVRHGLSGECLGRFAPSLQNMTRVVWNTPLGAYTSSTLAEIRAMRTHGEKRVHAILDVFHAVSALVAGMGTQEHLVVRLVPRRIDRVEHWTGRALQRAGIPSQQEIFDGFVGPLLEQVRADAPPQVAELAESRLGTSGPMTSVRQAARDMGLTRARVYQLLNEINDIMMVRWPLGRHQSHELREKLQAESAGADGQVDLAQFHAAVELFYPGARRGAAGPLEQMFEPAEEQELAEASSV